jgi:LPS-assembly protein
MPRAFASWEQRLRPWLLAGVDTEAVRFQKDEAVFLAAPPGSPPGTPPSFQAASGSRFDIKPYISLPLEGASWFVRPTVAWRYTAYGWTRNSPPAWGRTRVRPRAASRSAASMPACISTAARACMGSRSCRRSNRGCSTCNSPFREQGNLPVFDTGALTFSWGQMFRDNRYSGADRQADANQLTIALTSRLIRESDGRERFSASVGQIKYFDDSRVVLPGEQPILSGKSAWVADVGWAPTDRWTFGGSYQYNPKLRQKDLVSVRGRYLLPDDGVVNLAYRFRRDVSDQADFSFLYPINDTWSVVGRDYYSILDHKPLEQVLGVQWDSCCIAVRLVGRRYVHNREGELSRGFMLEIELKGLGSAGQDTRKTLRRAILGYNRGDLYLVPPETATGQPPTDTDPDPTP